MHTPAYWPVEVGAKAVDHNGVVVEVKKVIAMPIDAMSEVEFIGIDPESEPEPMSISMAATVFVPVATVVDKFEAQRMLATSAWD